MAFKKRKVGKHELKYRKVAGILLGLIFLVFGIMMYLHQKDLAEKAEQAVEWVRVPCVIEKSGIGIHQGSRRTEHKYSLDIRYRYEYEGRTYRSGDYSFEKIWGKPNGFRAENEALSELYPEGRETICFVNPGFPAEAVIYRKADNFLYWPMVIFIGLGVVLLFMGIIFIGRPPKKDA